MRRFTVLLALALALFAALGPVAEVVQACAQECRVDEPDGGCSADLCCSCCVHFRIEPPRVLHVVSAAVQARGFDLPSRARVASPEPGEILHVPKSRPLQALSGGR
jgi:hypothetical protein